MSKKIAVVTGGGTGVGKAITKALVDDGFEVVITGRRKAVLDDAVAEIDASAIHAVACDVSDRAAVAALFKTVEDQFGRLDLLVNNAGVFSPSVPLEELPADEWNKAVGANLSGTFFCTQEAFRMMKAQQPRGGRIINNGSISATTPRPNSAPYTATKHAITGLTKSASLDGRKFDIAVGQIDIGNAASDMTAKMSGGVMQADGELRPEPTIDAVHIARAVAYMASLPLDANVLTMTVMANLMPFVGRG
ncbi:SDR family oxidoreductase [Jiella sp. MQZ9-1]|uniref:SDR family oxidoreductase n=1 Tax=Jiella flava TaxID=2816857 RepID=A0A939G027_9HYPH|nr:SDR family oxidoreductase [Jiella flava]MBO0663370.1 SDR family oxidoreductase [Jiella flava]MCD2471946.1 SDR family oxidoreductase [Jiella flava]